MYLHWTSHSYICIYIHIYIYIYVHITRCYFQGLKYLFFLIPLGNRSNGLKTPTTEYTVYRSWNTYIIAFDLRSHCWEEKISNSANSTQSIWVYSTPILFKKSSQKVSSFLTELRRIEIMWLPKFSSCHCGDWHGGIWVKIWDVFSHKNMCCSC